jgi:hypothetical protein
MELNSLKQESNLTLSWLELSTTLQLLSQSLRHNSDEDISQHIVLLIEFCLTLAKSYDIDLQHAWESWDSKAFNKKYKT